MPFIDLVQESTDWDYLPAWLHNLQQKPMMLRWRVFHTFHNMRYVEPIDAY